MRRRELLRSLSLLPFAGLPPALFAADDEAQANELRKLGTPQAFDYAWLKGRAREMAAGPYTDGPEGLPKGLQGLNWDQYQAIQFDSAHALWGADERRFRAQFFHRGLFFKKPVHIYEVHEGMASELAYDPALFSYGDSGVDGEALPPDLGFAGFRLNFHTDLKRDVCAFLGASYFRAVGGEWQYGLSARGLAIDTALPRDEEFPRFTSFWLERPEQASSTVTVYALLDSPSTTGAYRFLITPGQRLVMDVDVAIYPRKPIERLGFAPLTSMYQVGENNRRMDWDWRPEIHDTDGLAMWTGWGEWLWRPLSNPPSLQFNAYGDNSPRGFGLLQRDRNFDHYQDDGVFYDRRPSLWIEPKGAWGEGSVTLVEIPTVDETFDNIVAFWTPKVTPKPGEETLLAYRMHWGGEPPVAPPLARTQATRTGLGGVVGQPRKHFSWRFAVDFAGGDFSLLGYDSKVEAVIEVSRGSVEITSARPLQAIGGYRAMFDLVPPDDSTQPINLRMFLQHDGQRLTETWIYQWVPPTAAERRRLMTETERR